MSGLRVQWVALAMPVLLVSACCGSVGGGVEVETAALALPPASHATAVPASWFVTADPGADFTPGALDDCAYRGDIDRLTTTLAVVEVSPTRVAVAGDQVVALQQGRVGDADHEGFLIGALYHDLAELRDRATDLSGAGCRPWAAGQPLMVDDRGLDEAPPLLLALDRGVPAETVAQVMYTAGQAEFGDLALWVADPEPAALVVESFDEELLSRRREDAPLAMLDGAIELTVAELDQRVGEGNPCTVLSVPVDDFGGEPMAAGADAAAHTLRSKDLVAVLPLNMPRIAMATLDPAPVIPTETLLTGHLCPDQVMKVQITTPPEVEDGLLRGLDLQGHPGLMEILEISPSLEDGAELSATPTP